MNGWMTSKGKYTENQVNNNLYLLDKKSEVMSCHICRVALLGVWLFMILGTNLESLAKLSHCSIICKHLGYHSHVHLSDVLWRKHSIWGQKPCVFTPSHFFTFYVALHHHLTSGNLYPMIWKCGWKGPPTLVVWDKLKIGVERLWKSLGAVKRCKVR